VGIAERCSLLLRRSFNAGGVVFSGQLTGEFEAFDADSSKKLWQFQPGRASRDNQ